MRGLGAFAVVLWHWQHFQLLLGPKWSWAPAGGAHRTFEPFYPLLRAFCEYGFWAVDLFPETVRLFLDRNLVVISLLRGGTEKAACFYSPLTRSQIRKR